MFTLPAITIERPADDEGMILELITKQDIADVIEKQFRIRVYKEDITFLRECPVELGLWEVQIDGLMEPVKYWVVPKPD